MSLPRKLCIAVAALAVCSIARAELNEFVHAMDAPAHHSAFVDSSVYSFADIANLPAGAEHRLLTGEAPSPVSDMTLAELSGAADARPAPIADGHVTGAPKGSVLTMNSVAGDLQVAGVADDFPASGSKAADSQTGMNFLFSASEIPPPADWMILVCVLIVVGFMARRKR